MWCHALMMITTLCTSNVFLFYSFFYSYVASYCFNYFQVHPKYYYYFFLDVPTFTFFATSRCIHVFIYRKSFFPAELFSLHFNRMWLIIAYFGYIRAIIFRRNCTRTFSLPINFHKFSSLSLNYFFFKSFQP